jgi:diguanylate cyclase (GGDEF)-like protein
MNSIKPMRKAMIVLCSFGMIVGLFFPLYAEFFVTWIPGKKSLFTVGCMVVGFFIGLAGYIVVKFILKEIDRYYKKVLYCKLGIETNLINCDRKDTLLTMEKEFENLLDTFVKMKKDEDEKLRKLCITDGLTELYNHRYLYEYYDGKKGMVNQASVLFCDVDHFKMFNDRNGHMAGDLVLREIGKIINKCVEGEGVAFRYGGEEFVVLLENYNLQEAYEMAENIRKKVCSSEILPKCITDTPITISIGISHYPTDAVTIEQLINKADKAMYYAKQNGRNQSQIYKIISDSYNIKGEVALMGEFDIYEYFKSNSRLI